MRVFIFTLLFYLPAMAVTEINWWHSMDGTLGKVVSEMAKTYNTSQKKYKINPYFKGNYTETLNAAIAAYRGKKQPHIVQVFEVGTLTMMKSGVTYPVYDLMKDHKIQVNWDEYLSPVLSYYTSSDNKLMSMPFNSSTPILFFNMDMLKKHKLGMPAKTWEGILEQSKKLVAAGEKCGLTVGWQSWVLLENFSAIHDVPLATQQNGFNGVDAKLKLNNALVAKNLNNLKKGMKSKVFSFEGRRSDPARNAFLAGKCAFYMDSSSSIGVLEKLAKFNWGTSFFPHYKDVKPKNSIIGGASLWVFKGHKKEAYAAVADFLNFLAKNKNQIWWHKKTGYLPITKSAYQQLKKEGYYKKNPANEVAILQLLRGVPSGNSKGVRLGNFTQIREVINEELEKIWAGSTTVEAGLAAMDSRGDRLLKRFARSVNRKK